LGSQKEKNLAQASLRLPLAFRKFGAKQKNYFDYYFSKSIYYWILLT